MSEFSLDDILDKYAHKDGDSKPAADADDILNDILGEEIAPRNRTRTRYEGVPTAELSRRELERQKQIEIEEKKRQAEHRRIEFERKQKEAEERKQAALAEKQRRAKEKKEAEAAEKRRLEEQKKQQELEAQRLADEERKNQAEAEKKKRENLEAIQHAIEEKERQETERKQKLAEEAALAAEAEQPVQQQSAEDTAQKTQEQIDAEEAEKQRLAREAEEKRRKADEEAEKRLATKSIILQDAPIELPSSAEPEDPLVEAELAEPTTAEISLEKVLRQQKIEIDAQKLLIKETELEDPDDFLNAMNPYEFGKKTGYTEQIETIPSEQLSGDTRGVDMSDIKEMSKAAQQDDTRTAERMTDGATRVMPDIEHAVRDAAIDPDHTFELNDDIKEFIPKTHDTREVKKHSEEEERLLRSINKTIEQNRIAEKSDTNPANIFGTGPFDKIVLPTRPMLFDSEGSDVLRTGEIPKSDPLIAEQKLKELASKRKRRLSNFVLEDIADDDIGYDDDDSDELSEAEDDTGLRTDLAETQKGLRIRFVLLLIVTLGLITANVLQEIFIRRKIGVFGNELGLLSNDGVVFANLICGVLGMILCSSVITTGIVKLFKMRADCDSVCALSCTLSVAAAVLNLVDTNDLQQGHAFLYVPVALLGLLFNSVGKLSMISRAKKNYRFVSSEGSKYYAEVIDGQSEASAFTKGAVSELPYLVTMRKTELLTDFLKKSYCEDMADRVSRKLVPISFAVGLIVGLLSYFLPNAHEINGVRVFEHNIYWSSSIAVAIICAMSPFSMMFMVNHPFKRASRPLLKSGTALLGYTSAEEFGEANSVLVDVSTLFPKSSVECTNIKPCKLQNSLNNTSLDMAIILAASLAIKSGSILSGLFFDMIGGNKEMIADIDGLIYEDNLGVMGWYGNKRVIMGSREQMKQHSIKIPEMSAIAKYSRNGSDCVYLAVGGELTVIFFIRITANPAVRASVKELTERGVSVILKTTDSLITIGKITDLFDVDPEKIKIIGASLHDLFNECTKYTTGGCGALSCTGSFVSLAKGINASKKLLKDISMSRTVMLTGVVLGALIMVFMSFSANTVPFMPVVIAGWNLLWMLIMLFLQCFRRY